MLQSIIQSLRGRSDLKSWSVRHIRTEGAQQYDLQDSVESKRRVVDERFIVDVLRDTVGPDGSPRCGASSITILPGGDISSALDEVSLMAGLVRNQVYDFAEAASLPEVPIADEQMKRNPSAEAEKALTTLKEVASDNPHVRLTAAECFAETETVRLVNSQGVDASQESTSIEMEWVFLAGIGDEEVEAFAMMKRRRAADLKLEVEAAHRTQQAADILMAGPPPSHRGPVVIRGETLATVMYSDVIQTLSSASMKYTGETQWEIGKPIFQGEAKGDPLNVWANRQLPYGVNSNLFDAEGLAAQRVELIRDNVLRAFWASQRFAQYLGFPATGQFGDIEVGPGQSSSEELLKDPHVEVAEFSWFNPDMITGDFSCEIRLGYVVDGQNRTPFKGGMLVGNLLDALSNVRWSSETGFYGNYHGPITARFGELVVVGENSIGDPSID